MTDAPSPFIPGTTLQFVWDSTSFGLLKECARKYFYVIIMGWSSMSESVHLKFGILFHKALEHYDLYAQTLSRDDAIDKVVEELLEETWDREHAMPWQSDHTKKNRDTLVRTVVWYLDHYIEEPAKTVILANGKPANELSFKLEFPRTSPQGVQYILSGHLDRVVEFLGEKYVMDHKTTGAALGSYFFSGFNPDNQMTLYTYAAKILFNIPVAGVIIDGAQIVVGYSSFARGITTRSQGQLDEWEENTQAWLGLAELYAETGNYPMNEKSCGNYGGCAFREVCGADPSVRDHFLRGKFTKKFWNPLENR